MHRCRSGSWRTAIAYGSGTPKSSSTCAENLPHATCWLCLRFAHRPSIVTLPRQSIPPGAATRHTEGAPDAGVGSAAVARRLPSSAVAIYLVGAAHLAYGHLRTDGCGHGPPRHEFAPLRGTRSAGPSYGALPGRHGR